jgi:hypothetical protein
VLSGQTGVEDWTDWFGEDGNDAGMRWFSRRQNARGTRMDADGSLIWFGSDVADGLVPQADG